MRGFLASVACAVAVGIFGAYLIVAWFASLEYPR